MDRPDLVAAQETTGGSENGAAGPPLESVCRERRTELGATSSARQRVALGELGV